MDFKKQIHIYNEDGNSLYSSQRVGCDLMLFLRSILIEELGRTKSEISSPYQQNEYIRGLQDQLVLH